MKNVKRSVSYDGDTFKVRSDKVEIPNFELMDRMGVLIWLNQHTYARGYGTRTPYNPLQGLGGVINLNTR